MFLLLIILVVAVLILSNSPIETFATSPGTMVQLATSSPYYYHGPWSTWGHYIHYPYYPYDYGAVYHPSVKRARRRHRRAVERRRRWWRWW